jgi:1,2-diacylglycerol 3-alpha-glucosyltransferase
MNVVALTSVSSPYIVARYTAFSNQFPEANLFVIEFGSISTTYQWQPTVLETTYKRIVLSEQAAELQSPISLILALIHHLNQIQPDVTIIAGYANLVMLASLLWSKVNHKPAILLSATTTTDFPRSGWKEQIKRFVLKGFRSALVGGQPQKRYVVDLGMPEEAVFLGYDVVGNADFHPDRLKKLPCPLNKPYFLAVNRFVPKKNLLRLIAAYVAYQEIKGESAWDLVLCGDGQLLPDIQQNIRDAGLETHIHLSGFLQQDELLPYFAHARCFVHASVQEQWGLVVNEAMAAGLPVLVSDRCGCFEDLVLEGINGFGFDPEEQNQLTELMLKVSSDAVDLAAMGQASLTHIQNFSPDYFAASLMQAIDYALTHP